MVLVNINNNALVSIEYHRNLATIHYNIEKSLPMIIQIQITKTIGLLWEIVNDNLEAICGTKGVSVLWFVNLFDPSLDYINIDEELVATCPIIIASCAGTRDEDIAYEIHMCDHPAMYRISNKIISVRFTISSAGALCGCIAIVLSRRATDR